MPLMPTDHVLALLIAERDKLNRVNPYEPTQPNPPLPPRVSPKSIRQPPPTYSPVSSTSTKLQG